MNKTGTLGTWQGAGLLATTLLGTSVFILPQMTIDIAGQHAIWAWSLLTLSILPIALIFARLCAKYPHAGGPANFVELAFGKVKGQALGLSFLLVVPIGAPAALIMTYQFVDGLMMFNENIALLIQYGFIFSIYLLNIRGVSLAASIQLLLTLLIVIVVVALLLRYFMSFDGASHQSILHIQSHIEEKTVLSILPAAGLAFWSFLGIEAMAHLSTEFKNPKKNMTPAIIIATIVVGLIYVACTFLITHVPTSSNLAIVEVFNTLMGSGGHLIIGILGIAGGLATVNVYTASCCKLMQSLSNQKLLPSAYSRQNSNGVANVALKHLTMIMLVVLTVSHIFSLDLEILVGLCNGVFVLIYAVSMISAIKLLPRKYLSLIVVGLAVCIVLAVSLAWKMIYALLLLMMLLPIVKAKYVKHLSHESAQ